MSNPDLYILHLNDIYHLRGTHRGRKGGLARVAALRQQLADRKIPVLMLHAGDFLSPSVMTKVLGKQQATVPMMTVLDLLGWQNRDNEGLICTFGNHEFDEPDAALLLKALERENIHFVSANVNFTSDPMAQSRKPVPPYRILDMRGLKVGIFGLTCPVPTRQWAQVIDRHTQADVYDQQLANMRQALRDCHVKIALTHQELFDDRWLASQHPWIDLIAGGHEHEYMAHRERDTWIVQGTADAEMIPVVEVVSHPNQRPGLNVVQVKLDATQSPNLPKDAEISRVIDMFFERLDLEAHKTLPQYPQTVTHLEGTDWALRQKETAPGNFLADILRDVVKADVGLLNAGAIRLNDDIE